MKKLSIIFVLALIIGVFLSLSDQSNVSAVEAVTYDDLITFLEQDDISCREGNPITYNCANRALDLWHNAYLSGIDAFIIVLDEPSKDWHCRVGFYSMGDIDLPYLERGYTSYWGDSRHWFHVEPLADCILTRAVVESSWPDEVITVLSPGECLQLWSMGNSILPRAMLVGMVTLHKVERFLIGALT